mgnify:CR=1 FL=1
MTDMDSSNIPALDVINLFYFFKFNMALKGISFSVQQNSIHGFVGPNGAGKTTTLKLAATLLKPQGKGIIKVFGLDIDKHYVEIRRKIGFMPDNFCIYKQMTVFEYLDFFAAAYGLETNQRNKIIADLLALTDMEGRKNDYIKGLSRGMQQRVSLARVLVHDPALLLLDEPASGLDPRARIELMEILHELQKMGKTIFISSHILSELSDLCDSVTILDNGSVKYSGSMTNLLRYDHEETKFFRLEIKEKVLELSEKLKQTEGIIEVEENGLTYKIAIGNNISSNAILQTAINSGVEIVSFKEDMKHLNQVFLDLTAS